MRIQKKSNKYIVEDAEKFVIFRKWDSETGKGTGAKYVTDYARNWGSWEL